MRKTRKLYYRGGEDNENIKKLADSIRTHINDKIKSALNNKQPIDISKQEQPKIDVDNLANTIRTRINKEVQSALDTKLSVDTQEPNINVGSLADSIQTRINREVQSALDKKSSVDTQEPKNDVGNLANSIRNAITEEVQSALDTKLSVNTQQPKNDVDILTSLSDTVESQTLTNNIPTQNQKSNLHQLKSQISGIPGILTNTYRAATSPTNPTNYAFGQLLKTGKSILQKQFEEEKNGIGIHSIATFNDGKLNNVSSRQTGTFNPDPTKSAKEFFNGRDEISSPDEVQVSKAFEYYANAKK